MKNNVILHCIDLKNTENENKKTTTITCSEKQYCKHAQAVIACVLQRYKSI